MNFGQLQTLATSWVDDPNTTYFTPAQLQVWLNNAQSTLAMKLINASESWYRRTVQTNLTVAQQCYLLPSDFVDLLHVELVLSGSPPNETKVTLTHSTVGESDIVNYNQAQPLTYYLEKNCLVVVPAPDQAYLLRMKYAYLPPDMVFSTEVPDIPKQYHEYLAILAAKDGFLKDRRESADFTEKREYFEDMIRKTAQARMRDKPREVVQTWDDGFGALF